MATAKRISLVKTMRLTVVCTKLNQTTEEVTGATSVQLVTSGWDDTMASPSYRIPPQIELGFVVL